MLNYFGFTDIEFFNIFFRKEFKPKILRLTTFRNCEPIWIQKHQGVREYVTFVHFHGWLCGIFMTVSITYFDMIFSNDGTGSTLISAITFMFFFFLWQPIYICNPTSEIKFRTYLKYIYVIIYWFLFCRNEKWWAMQRRPKFYAISKFPWEPIISSKCNKIILKLLSYYVGLSVWMVESSNYRERNKK